MSFRDTFTRGSGNEHLQYDDTASMFFVATVLLVVTLWLAIHLLKKVMRPWGDIRGLKEAASNPALKQKVIQFKKERRYSFITFWFVLKVACTRNVGAALFCVGVIILCYCDGSAAESEETKRI